MTVSDFCGKCFNSFDLKQTFQVQIGCEGDITVLYSGDSFDAIHDCRYFYVKDLKIQKWLFDYKKRLFVVFVHENPYKLQEKLEGVKELYHAAVEAKDSNGMWFYQRMIAGLEKRLKYAQQNNVYNQ